MSRANRLRIALFHARPHPLVLLAVAGVPVLAVAWAMLSPGVVLLRRDPLDIMFNLAGAWAVAGGQVPHVDFHEVVGALNFFLTAAGFRLVGPEPMAFLVGETIVLAALFAAAVPVAARRLALVPAASFVLFAALPAIVPLTPGTLLHNYSFGMSYNRYGWAATSILFLILFVPPRRRYAALVEPGIAAVLLIAMFHIKITYFVVGLAAIVAGLVISGHVRAARAAWAGVVALLLANAIAPWNRHYLIDVADAIRGSVPQISPGNLVRLVFDNAGECAFYATAVLACWLLWRRGLARPGLPLAAAFILAATFALLSQNTQPTVLTLAPVIAFLLYDAVARHRRTRSTVVLAGLLLAPAMAIAANLTVIAGYHAAASRPATLWIIDRTALAGLAMQFDHTMQRPRSKQADYLAGLVEAADLLAGDGRDAGRVRLFDRINPMPFVLGAPPLAGGYMWWDFGMPALPVEDFLGSAAHVLIPKDSSLPVLTEFLTAHYADYLAAHFPLRRDTPNWTLLSREAPQP